MHAEEEAGAACSSESTHGTARTLAPAAGRSCAPAPRCAANALCRSPLRDSATEWKHRETGRSAESPLLCHVVPASTHLTVTTSRTMAADGSAGCKKQRGIGHLGSHSAFVGTPASTCLQTLVT